MQTTPQQIDIKKQRNARFIKGLAVFFFACLAIALAGLFWFWGFLGRYEMQTPDAALREYTQLIKNGDFETIYKRGNFAENELNNKDKYIDSLRKVYTSGEEIKYTKRASQGKTITYAVYIDGKAAGDIQLYENGNSKGPTLSARPVLEGNQNVKINAPQNAQIFLDGEPLAASYIVSESVNKDYKKAPEALVPKMVTYQVDGLLTTPEITAEANGRSCVVLDKNGEYNVLTAVSGIDVPEYEQVITKASKTYAKFVSKDALVSDVLALSMKDTTFAKSIRNFSNIWYIPHDTYEFDKFQVKDLVEHSENAFSGYVSFDYVVKHGNKTNVFPSNYYMMFLKENDVWKLYDLHTL